MFFEKIKYYLKINFTHFASLESGKNSGIPNLFLIIGLFIEYIIIKFKTDDEKIYSKIPVSNVHIKGKDNKGIIKSILRTLSNNSLPKPLTLFLF